MFLRKINFVVFMLKIRRMFEFECVVIFIESPFIRRNCLINLESIKWWNILHSRKLIVDLFKMKNCSLEIWITRYLTRMWCRHSSANDKIIFAFWLIFQIYYNSNLEFDVNFFKRIFFFQRIKRCVFICVK